MSTLKGTPLETIYKVFGVETDAELCSRMANIGLIYTVIVGVHSLLKPAPYGRYAKGVYGTINARLGWMIQECMAFFCPALIILLTPAVRLNNFANLVAIALFMFHYFHRSFIYPMLLTSESKPAPIITVVAAIVFCAYNGILQGVHLASVAEVKDEFNVFIGTTIFLAGMAINITHDRMLVSLRKCPAKSGTTGDTAKTKYKIPRGGVFEYVSGANYLGEIIEWIGWALITLGYPQIIFAIFSTIFLGIRAVHHHRFYKSTFGPSYPQSRKAIIPFVL